MNNFFYYIIFIAVLVSCSEGDVIENDISNFTAPLENCSNQNESTFVFFKIDSQINQSLSLSFTSTTFELNTAPEGLTQTIELNNTTNTLVYRQFNAQIDGSAYFCSSVPPSGITITQELKSSNGNAVIKYVVKSDTATEIVYTRTITLTDITLEGAGISIRQELLELGEDEITVLK
ncbi:hypothetical protein [Aquimarina macrocephali]|uniref:hypothetical protein n=1 Tax=Aquimarina macrocephali TaxID=666563 RepID=UPI0004B40663|nr:hypothetical protein [Aquimarina macrocephali]